MEPNSLEKKSKPPQEGEVPFNMNNFHSNLPDGRNRGLKSNPEVMNAIDELLAGEFANLDVTRISETIFDAGQALQTAMDPKHFTTIEAMQAAVGPQVEAADRAREELRPLFNKLLKMGFNPELLAR